MQHPLALIPTSISSSQRRLLTGTKTNRLHEVSMFSFLILLSVLSLHLVIDINSVEQHQSVM